MDSHRRLMLANRAWAKEKLALKPKFFTDLAREQRPEFLWIGCSDSRVPAEEITGTEPGEIFVHRNIANLVVATDFNLLSVLQYAVDFLKVKHIIVCGHHGCGGVRAAMQHQNFGYLNKWLRHIKDEYQQNRTEIDSVSSEDARVDKLVELNVRQQLINLTKTSIVQRAWQSEQRPLLHGWVYGMKDGLLQSLLELGPGDPIDEVYRFDFPDLKS